MFAFLILESKSLLRFGSTGSFPVRKAAGTWKDFAVRCAPNTAWLQVSSTSGTLTKSGGTAGSGSVTTEDVAKAGQDGGVCVVSALHKVGSKWLPRQTKVMALFPQPWGSLHYPTSSIQVTLGEQLPILKLPHAGLRTLKPNDFFVACDVNHGLKYSFDHLLGTGLLEGPTGMGCWIWDRKGAPHCLLTMVSMVSHLKSLTVVTLGNWRV